MKQFYITLLFGFIIFFPINAQQETDLREVFLTAEMYFNYEEYNEALPLYLRLHRHFPDNDNYNYKIGVCFLNNPYEKNKAINYLELAANNINPKYKENNFKEEAAPLEALFYLGTAYRINNNLTKAREYYNRFLNELDPEIYDDQLVKEQLAACEAAERLMKKPIDFDVKNIGQPLNTRFADKRAVLSGDENKIVFISELQFYDAIFFSEKLNGKWQYPRNIVPELGVDGDVYPTCLSYNGTELFVYRNDDFIGNLYHSRFVNGKWTPLQKLNDNINTKYWESHASISKDGKTLYFSSNRKGGFGGLDIYKSSKQTDGEWGPAINLGSVINSKYNDDTPFINENEDKIFFSSYGHFSMGGYDIFMSIKKTDGSWASPVNLGYPINTTDDDQFFLPLKDGQIGYFSKFTEEDGFGRHDIYRYQVYTPDHPRLFNVNGLLDFMGESADASNVLISVIDKNTGDTIQQVNANADGNFTVQVPAGDYNMVFESDRFKQHIADLQVAQNSPHEGFFIPGPFALEPIPIPLSQEELNKILELKDTLIIAEDGKAVKIRFNAEKGSTAVIDILNDSTLVATDTLEVDKRRMVYEFEPQPDVNDVSITITDPDGNVVTKMMQVIYPVSEETNGTETDTISPLSGEEDVALDNNQPENADDQIQNIEFIEHVSTNAEGNLKTFLKQEDFSAQGINNETDLFEYLYNNIENKGYTVEDVDELLKKLTARKSMKRFLAELEQAAEGNLKTTIANFDPDETGINDPRQLVDYLIEISGKNRYSDKDVVTALSIVAAGSREDPAEFLHILNSQAEGDLSNYLGQYVMNENITDVSSLGQDLYKNAKSETVALLDLLTSLAVSKDAELMRKRLHSLAEGDLKALLDTLNLEANSICTADDLIDYLFKNENNLNYTREEVVNLLTNSIRAEQHTADLLKNQMTALATGKFKEALSELNLQSANINSPEDLLNYLRAMAEEKDYSQSDINEILLKLAYKGDLDDVIKRMSEFAEGNLKLTLLSLDPEKENIKDISQLIEYLFENAGKNGYTEEDVIKMLSEYSNYGELETFLRNLIKLSEGETKEYLKSLNPDQSGISNKQDLINHLLSEADKGILEKEGIISLILRADKVPADALISALQNLSDNHMMSLINSLPANLMTADEVYKYMCDNADKYGLNRKDVIDLFADYLDNYKLHVFLNKLRENSGTNLLEALNNLNPKEKGIENLAGLIKYLLDNAEEFGYTVQDVYKAIGASVHQDNLQKFIHALAKYATGNLRKALDDIFNNQLNFKDADELIKYLLENAEKYGYSESDVWNLLLKLMMNENIDDSEVSYKDSGLEKKVKFRGAVIWSFSVLAFLGLIIFIFILWERRKKKKDSEKK